MHVPASPARRAAIDADTEKLREYMVTLSGGIRVRTIDEGSGSPLLLLHGNPDNADEWRALIALLRGRFRCIAPDLPGYGRRGSTYALPESYDYSREAQVGFVDALLAQLDVRGKITLVVHDIGGIMGVPWAARYTDRLSAVVYTNTVAFPRHVWFKLAYRWGNDSSVGRPIADLSMDTLGWFGGSLFRRVFSGQHPQLSRSQLDRFTADFACNRTAKSTTLVEFRRITRPDFFDGCDQMLRSIAASAPTATVWGGSDPYIADRLAGDLMAQETSVLSGVGHWVPIVAADVLARQILSTCGMP
jgi:pimeloyl-ACP methyl ester carboxylesterase